MSFPRISIRLLNAAGLLLPIAAFAAHPLITEDTGTQGTGKFQLEVNAGQGYQDGDGSQTHNLTKTATLTYGLVDSLDLIFTMQHSETTVLTAGERSSDKGVNDSELDLKWRFYDQDGLSFGLKPGITFPSGDESKGLGTGKATYSLVFVNSIQLDPWQLNWHVGYRHNHNKLDQREYIWHGSASVLRKLNDNLKLVADIGGETTTDKNLENRLRFLVLGAIYSPTENLDLDIGIRKEALGPAVNYVGLAGLTLRW